MNRFISLMPSSMCWPFGPGSQRSRRGTAVAGACQGFSAHTPVRLTQPPRFVEMVTSGLAVTMRSASGPPSRDSSTRALPKTSCVEVLAGTRLGSESGTSDGAHGRGIDGRSRAARVQARRGLAAQLAFWRVRREARPFVVDRDTQLGAQRVDLWLGEQRGVVQRVAREGQPPALHGVGEQHGRLACAARRLSRTR